MRLHAVLVPPEPARQELAEVVRSVAPETPELDAVPADRMLIPVTGLGQVSHGDAQRLLRHLRVAAGSWRPPQLRFTGGGALEWPGDESVWARLDGDLDGLEQVGRGVPTAVQPLGFLVDRRAFRTWMAVGTITDETTAPYLELLVAALDGFTGRTWRLQHLTLLRRRPGPDGVEGHDEVWAEVPFGGPAEG